MRVSRFYGSSIRSGLKRWIAMILIIMVTLGLSPNGYAFAAGPAVTDQEQVNENGTIWVSDDERYQTFTPAITGNFDKIDLNLSVRSGLTGVIQVDLAAYVDSNQIADWASDAIRTAITESLVKGYEDELRPQRSLTRAETTVLIYRMLLKAGLIEG